LRIYRSDTPDGPWDLVSDSSRQNIYRRDENLSPDTYYYAATAVNAAGQEGRFGAIHGIRVGPPWVGHAVKPFLHDYPTGVDTVPTSIDFINASTRYMLVQEAEPTGWRTPLTEDLLVTFAVPANEKTTGMTRAAFCTMLPTITVPALYWWAAMASFCVRMMPG
jgi:hypothetical protein